MVENTQQKERKGGKLENKYSGPYIIKTSDGKGVYTLKDLDFVINAMVLVHNFEVTYQLLDNLTN